MGIWQRSGWHARVLAEVRGALAVRALTNDEEGTVVCTTIVPASALGVVRVERALLEDRASDDCVAVRRALGALPYQAMVALLQPTSSRTMLTGVEPRQIAVVPPSRAQGSGIVLSPTADLLDPPLGLGLLRAARTSPYQPALAAYVYNIATLLEPALPAMAVAREMCCSMIEPHAKELLLSVGMLASWLVLPSSQTTVPLRRLINHLSRQTSGSAVPRLLDALFPGRRQSDNVTVDELVRVFDLTTEDRILAFCSPLLPPHLARFYLASIHGRQVELPADDQLPTFVVPQGSTTTRLYPLYHTIAASLQTITPSREGEGVAALSG